MRQGKKKLETTLDQGSGSGPIAEVLKKYGDSIINYAKDFWEQELATS